MASSVVKQTLGIQNDQMTALSISQDGTSGSALSAIVTVPTGKVWRIKAVSATNPDTVARALSIDVLDPTGQICLNIVGDIATTKAQNLSVNAANVDIDLPAGYQVRLNAVAIGAFVPNLKLVGFEYNQGLPTSVITID